ncbi:MAG: hypothetical protein WBA41_20135 [Rivularia sp. (in: cyanobacteria)]
MHQSWTMQYQSSLETRGRYTPTDCFETFPFPESTINLETIGEKYYNHRQNIMLARQQGLTKTYNRFHNPDETATDIQQLRELHVEMDKAVAAAYGWSNLDLEHGFQDTKQGLRFTISETARRKSNGNALPPPGRICDRTWCERKCRNCCGNYRKSCKIIYFCCSCIRSS